MQAINLSGIIRVSLLALFVFVATFSNAQATMADYKAGNDGWLVDIHEAYEKSQQTGKPILANFTGSDWCGYCIKLSRNVFNKKEFKAWADKNVVLLELDYPKRKLVPQQIRQQNESLKRAFRIRGYPSVFVFDLSKNEKGEFAISSFGRINRRSMKAFTDDADAMLARRNSGE